MLPTTSKTTKSISEEKYKRQNVSNRQSDKKRQHKQNKMYVVLVVIFTLVLIAVLIFFARLKKRKRIRPNDTFLIGKPKGPKKESETETQAKETQTETTQAQTDQKSHIGQIYTQIQSHTGPKGERGLPGLPFQLNGCGNLVDGLMHDMSNTNIPFYYYAVSKDLRTYRTDIPQDLSSHLICYVAKTQQWFDLGSFASFASPPTFLNVRSFETDTSFQVPDHTFYIKYQLWKENSYMEGVTEVHPGQIIQLTVCANITDISPKNQQNCVSYPTSNTTPRIVLWY